MPTSPSVDLLLSLPLSRQISLVSCFNLWGIIRWSAGLAAQIETFSSSRSRGPRCALHTEPWGCDGWVCLSVLWPFKERLFLQESRENDLGHAAARPHFLAGGGRRVLLGSRLGVASGDPIKSVSPSSSLVRSGDLKIKEVFHHLLHVMHRINRERER